jgi:hypothetical protein
MNLREATYTWGAATLCVSLVFAIAINEGRSQQVGGQNCATVFECSKVAVKQAADARFALEEDKKLIEGLRNQIVKLQEQVDALSRRLDGFKIAVGAAVTGKVFNHEDFWTSVPDTPVNFICPGNDVLAGMNFVMRSDSVARHPYRVEYICKTLGP